MNSRQWAAGLLVFAWTAFPASAQNPIVLENQDPGTDPGVWYVEGPGDPNIQGFGTDISVNRGDTVHFKIDTDASAYHIDIYRLGYYHGNGARNVGTGMVTATLPQSQPACLYEVATGLTDCGNWAESAHWDVPPDAVSGIYVAKLTRDDATPGTSQIIFIVRDDASTSDLLFQTSDATWQAYNLYGGKSVYPAGGGPPGFNHATKASYNRPFDVRHADGAPGDNVFAAEYPMVRWLEANGYDVTYTSSVDTDRRGSLIPQHRVFLSVGHDEYWSGPQRANVTAARDAGVNLAFFSGNEVYWKTRYESSTDASNTPYRTLVVYKEGSLGENVCGTKCDPDPAWTGLWRDGCAPTYDPGTNGGCLPENALTGQISWDGSIGAIQVPDTYKDLRFWRNTSIAALAPGQTATLGAESLGSEWDWEHPQYQSSYPPRRIKLSTTVLNGLTHHLSLYRADSGALVFGAGTIQWSWGLDSFHTFNQVGTNPDMRQATVNLFADMGAEPGSLQPGLIEATASSDMQSPASVITAPANGATTALNSTVDIEGTAADAGGGVVAGVEVSVDGGATWHAATGASTWSYAWSPTAEGVATIKSRAFDDTGNLEDPTGPANVITVTVTAPECPCSVFPSNEAPATPSGNDGSGANELGMRFRADVDGFITALRYYKPAGATGTHTGNLWTNTGTNLARQVFTNETASGWQEVALPTSVAITAGTTYVVSYFSASGDYTGVNYYFTHQVGNGLVHGLADGADGANGLYQYTATTTFPTQSFRSSNYYADVVFSTSPGPDVTPPTVSSHVPATDATGVPTSSTVTVTFSEPIDPPTLNAGGFELRDTVADAVVAATISYDAATRTATLTPGTALVQGRLYTVKLKGGAGGVSDVAGNPLAADYTWSFTATADNCPCSIWDNTPGVGPNGFDSNSYELGVKFRSSQAGFVSALRFYKYPENTGAHVGHLWDINGNLLGSAAFTGETASGWQEAALNPSVPISANTVYVASYSTETGNYAFSAGFFASQGADNGPLHALSAPESPGPGTNGIFNETQGDFPNTSFNNTNYWVDLVFDTSLPGDVTPPEVTAHVPSTGATAVPVNSTVTVTFSEALDPGTVSGATLELRDALNAPVPASVAWDSGTKTATLTPAASLELLTTYTATVHGGTTDPRIKDASGNALAADMSWSFTTAGPAPQSFTVIPPAEVPTSPLVNDNAGAMELGMRFRADADGVITALRYYKPVGATGTHTGNLWTGAGTNLARQVFTSETASGWQEVMLPTPVPVTAGTTYVVSYFTASGDYLGVNFYFTQQRGNGLVHGLADGADGANGLYQYTATTTFPTQTYRSSNYYADVVFIPYVADVTPPTVTAHVPATAATGVPPDSTVTVTFSEALDASTVSGATFELRDALNASVPASVTWDSGTQTATLTPAASLNLLTTYTAIVHGGTTDPRITDPSGNALAADVSWSFTTAASASCPCQVFPPGEAPTNPVSNDHDPAGGIELGMKFRADADGVITALRYYKPAGATGAHLGNLWTSAGTNLAQQAFANETASGWQEVTLTTPVPVTAGTTYIVSYFSASGDYVSTLDYFTQQVGTGPVHGIADGADGPNGLYQYTAATTLPTQSFRSSNYYADVVFNFNPSLLPQTITFDPLADRRVDSGAFAVSATASSGLAVTFSSLTTPVCTVAGTTVTLVSTGSCSLAADQAGDATYAPAPQVTQSFSVTEALLGQTIDFPAIADQPLNTGSFEPPVSASSGLAVTITSQTLARCTVSGATVVLVATGTCTLQASQPGNATYAAATPVLRSFGILEPPDTIPPVISNVAIATSTDGSATVSWQTNEPADGRLQILAPVSAEFYDAFLLLGHSFTITGLTPGETYSYRITAVDAALNAASLPPEDQPPATFTMPEASIPDVPVVSFPLSPASPIVVADYRKDIGYSQLQQELGASIPDGADVVVSQVETTTQVGGEPAWMPDILDAEFAGKTITDESNAGAGPYSGFATAVGRDFYGNSTSIAPAIASIGAFSAGNWLGGGFLQTIPGTGGPAPQASTSRITNHSWVGTASDFDTYVLPRLDWLIDTDESIQVVAVDNGDGDTGNNLDLLTSAYNVISVGRSDGQQLLGSAAVDGTYTAGRPRPDIVDPADSTLSTTPHVAAAAALLVETGHANPDLSTDPVTVSVTNRAGVVVWNAERSEVIKAALMAGADRVTHNSTSINLAHYRGSVADQTANGLDRRYGAGQLNIRNSYWIIAGGEQNSSEDGNEAASVASRGFDYDPHFGGLNGSNSTATYPLPVQTHPSVLTASLVWNLAVAGGAADNFDSSATLRDLNVAVIDLGNGDAVVASSASALENTENLSLVVPANAQYALRVTRTGNFDWDYGVAWQLLPDADADGVYDSQDNCINAYNPAQIDGDGDGYGNICDGDLNNNGATNTQDYGIFRTHLGTTTTPPAYDIADLNGNGVVNTQDYGILRTLLGSPPGSVRSGTVAGFVLRCGA